MRDIIAMVLAGGRVEELSVLTQYRTKAAVPFGGHYQIIDFALSCLMQAGIERVGVISMYRPHSLMTHLGTGATWDMVGRGRGVEILPPYTKGSDDQWYRGTADAIVQNLDFVLRNRPRDVLILSGDHIYHMNFQPLIEQHHRTGADLTMAVKHMDPAVGQGRFGIVEMDERGMVTGYQEKPQRPRSNVISLTIYLFRTEVLIARLEESNRRGKSYQIYSEVIPSMVGRDRVYAYCHKDYWNYVRSVDAYHAANMDLLGPDPSIRLENWGIRTTQELRGLGDLPPARFESQSQCANSVVSAGAFVAGEVTGSVLSPGVCVEAGAKVCDSVLMHNTVVRSGANVDRAVLDHSVEVSPGAIVGYGEVTSSNRSQPSILQSGVTLVGSNVHIPEGTRIGRNCVIAPSVLRSDWSRMEIATGESLGKAGEES